MALIPGGVIRMRNDSEEFETEHRDNRCSRSASALLKVCH